MRGNLEARRLIDKRTIELARLRWTLEDQTRRLERGKRWLESSPDPAPTPSPQASHEVSDPAPQDPGRRKVQIKVTESREVSITLEEDDETSATDPDVIEHPRRSTP